MHLLSKENIKKAYENFISCSGSPMFGLAPWVDTFRMEIETYLTIIGLFKMSIQNKELISKLYNAVKAAEAVLPYQTQLQEMAHAQIKDSLKAYEDYKPYNSIDELKETAKDILDNYITLCCNNGEEYDDVIKDEVVESWVKTIEKY